MPDELEKYEAFCEATKPIRLRKRPFTINKDYPVHVLSHKKKWITGVASFTGWPDDPMRGMLFLRADKPIEGGTSGGTIVDDDGSLIGVVSNSFEQECKGKYVGTFPIARLALPQWTLGWIEPTKKKKVKK